MKKKIYICNQCGKEIFEENGITKEDFIRIIKRWGYFSHKDGVTHEVCLCEQCYDQWIGGFSVPVTPCDTVEII